MDSPLGNEVLAPAGVGTAGQTIDQVRLGAMLESTFHTPGYQPPLLPSTAMELIEITRRPDVTYRVVAAVLEKSPLIASQVLRIAQSAAYRRAAPIRSLDQAASLLGLRTLADLFLQATLTSRVFRVAGYEKPMNRLRDHSAATAIVSRLVCHETSYTDDYAFLCGLLHDVGTVACIIALVECGNGERDGGPPPFAQAWPVIRDMHEVASARLAQIWQLPSNVGVVIGHHHSLASKGVVHPLAAIVCVADAIATELGHAFESEIDSDQVARAQTALELTDAQLTGIRRSAERMLSAP
jgi:HD-like signal output (HDOD) protein